MTQKTTPIDLETGEIIGTAAVAAPTQAVEPAAEKAVAATPLDMPAELFTAALERRKANRAALMDWIRGALVEGTDYGRIHRVGKSKCKLAAQGRSQECIDPAHWSKHSLFKPGAEKICGMLGVSAHFPTLQDYEKAVLEGRIIQQVILRCELRDAGGRTVAVGARALAQDENDLNKALKMAEKSSHIDATLRMAGLSEVFTQDLEDMPPRQGQAAPAEPGRRPVSPTAADSATAAGNLGNGDARGPRSIDPNASGTLNSGQKKRLEARIKGLKLDRERVKIWIQSKWGVAHFQELSVIQFRELDGKLDRFAAQMREERKTQPIPEEKLKELTDYIHKHALSAEDVKHEAGVKALSDITYGQLKEVWKHLYELAQSKQQDAPKEALPGMATYLAAEAKAGRSGTHGT